MRVFTFYIDLSYQDFLPFYQGLLQNVEVKDQSGKILWINGRHFRPFFSLSGVKGRFELILNDMGGMISLKKLE